MRDESQVLRLSSVQQQKPHISREEASRIDRSSREKERQEKNPKEEQGRKQTDEREPGTKGVSGSGRNEETVEINNIQAMKETSSTRERADKKNHSETDLLDIVRAEESDAGLP